MHLSRGFKTIASGVVLAAAIAIPAEATSFDDVYAFGDSSSDVGNVYTATARLTPVSPPYDEGRFSNGPVWVEELAERLGLDSLEPSLTGGDNYAFGGAQTGETPVHSLDARDLSKQVSSYELETPRPDPEALYTLWVGANDVNGLASSILSGAIARGDARTDIAAAIDNVAQAVDRLAHSGMQHLLALNVPDLSKTPSALAAARRSDAPAQVLGLYRRLSQAFNIRLERALQAQANALGFDLDVVDTFSLIDRVAAKPPAFGFANVTEPCWTGDFLTRASGAVCENPDAHLFWDRLHASAAAHSLIAARAQAALTDSHDLAAPAGFGLGVFAMLMLIAMRCLRRCADRAGLPSALMPEDLNSATGLPDAPADARAGWFARYPIA